MSKEQLYQSESKEPKFTSPLAEAHYKDLMGTPDRTINTEIDKISIPDENKIFDLTDTEISKEINTIGTIIPKEEHDDLKQEAILRRLKRKFGTKK